MSRQKYGGICGGDNSLKNQVRGGEVSQPEAGGGEGDSAGIEKIKQYVAWYYKL
jgi:hypothetical protein